MRKYKKPVLFDDNMVLFEMENGWFYLVTWDLGQDSILVLPHPMFYTKFNPYCKSAESENDVPAETLKKAKELLQKLPIKTILEDFKRYEPFDEHENPYQKNK